jgi:pSer/pThr/pTyr-binding forkhead associated (FHA) protein
MGGAPPGLPPGLAGPPPPLPAQYATTGQAVPSGLFAIFNGQKFQVNKEEFVIGRGSKTSDLPIKDGNISRRHAAVVFHGGQFYMKDLGSTNGIEYGGQRIDSKRIEEGDIFHICDYEIRFTYYG